MKTLLNFYSLTGYFTLTLLAFCSQLYAQTVAPYIDDDWPDSRYTINADNTVTDIQINLIWQRCSIGQDQTSTTCSGSTTTHNWQDALALASSDTTAGFNDWRLPNVEELRSIAAINRMSPAINTVAFPNTVSFNYWSSSPIASFSRGAWSITFGVGDDVINFRSDGFRVRLVRGG